MAGKKKPDPFRMNPIFTAGKDKSEIDDFLNPPIEEVASEEIKQNEKVAEVNLENKDEAINDKNNDVGIKQEEQVLLEKNNLTEEINNTINSYVDSNKNNGLILPKPKKTKKTYTNLYLTEDTNALLEKYVEKTGYKKSALAEILIKYAIENLKIK